VSRRAPVPHGFRSTFRNWAGETRTESMEVVERALAHTIKEKGEAAYGKRRFRALLRAA
jgi:integrase